MLIDSLPELPRYSRRTALALIGGFAGGVSILGCGLRGEPQPPVPAPKAPTQPVEPDPVVAQPTQPVEPTVTPRAEPILEPRRDPTPAPTKEPTKEPTPAPKPPEAESPFPVYGVFEGEYRSGKQTSYVVITTPLDERVGAAMTYLHGLEECSADKLSYAPGFIVVDRATFLAPGFKRGRFDVSYDQPRQILVGKLVIPPDSEFKACDAQMIPFQARFVGSGPETFLQAHIRSYQKVGLFTDQTRAARARDDIAKYIGELPP